MKNLSYLKIVVLFSFLFFAFFPANNNAPDLIYKISPSSKLEIKGQTNLNSFSCLCNEKISPRSYFVENQQNKNSLRFKNTSLDLKIKSFDCGNNIMNKDLQKALNADIYPSIKINLLEIKENKCNGLSELKDWVKLKALTNISLNGNSNDYWIEITAKKYSPTKYRFIGTQNICMLDFCIDPPTALMGIIKVKDEINIFLDLEVEVEQ